MRIVVSSKVLLCYQKKNLLCLVVLYIRSFKVSAEFKDSFDLAKQTASSLAHLHAMLFSLSLVSGIFL